MIKTGQLSVFISNTLDLTGNATENKHYFCAAVCRGSEGVLTCISCVSVSRSVLHSSGGRGAAKLPGHTATAQTCQGQKTKQNTEELLSATLLTSSGGKCLYMINKT